jgi:hypothetical protein
MEAVVMEAAGDIANRMNYRDGLERIQNGEEYHAA